MAEVTHETDVLVIGSGFAGNRAALGAAEAGARVLQVTLGAGGSPNIMGFSAPVVEGDSAEVIYADLMKSGLEMNDPVLSRVYAVGTTELVADFEALDVPFKKDASGRLIPLHSLGTTYPRLVHQYQCLTGLEIQKALNRKIRSNTKIATRTGTLISDLLVDSGRVCGACGVDGHTGEVLVIKARAVILAAGGSGRIHSFTTYPNDVTGDGMAMAYRVGLRVRDMELLQFEPCCFVAPSRIRGYVNPTTFLKMGAVLRNGRGDVFINDYSTIQKDELSRKIHKEILEGRGTPAGGVYYDLRMLSEEVVKVTHYVHYQPALVEGGIDICKEVSEVAPAGHSFQGGVITRPDCSTDIEGLFVAGETMGGIHGANRMGGDAGGAALVFGKIAGKTVAAAYPELAPPDSSTVQALADETLGIIRKAQNKRGASPSALKIGIQEMMQTKVGLIKTEECLSAAARELEAFDGEFDDLSADSPSAIRDLLSVRNMLLTARMMVFCSRARKESRGVHYRSDYPERNDAEWSGKSVVVSQDNHGKMTTTIQVRK